MLMLRYAAAAMPLPLPRLMLFIAAP